MVDITAFFEEFDGRDGVVTEYGMDGLDLYIYIGEGEGGGKRREEGGGRGRRKV